MHGWPADLEGGRDGIDKWTYCAKNIAAPRVLETIPKPERSMPSKTQVAKGEATSPSCRIAGSYCEGDSEPGCSGNTYVAEHVVAELCDHP